MFVCLLFVVVFFFFFFSCVCLFFVVVALFVVVFFVFVFYKNIMAVRDVSVSACLSHPKIKLLSQAVHHCYMSRLMTKPTKGHVHPAKAQISLGIRQV